MIKIGITGGLGSGKSVIAQLLEVIGIPVYIADEESKKLTDTSPVIRNKLIDFFGDSIYTTSGLNKQLLASKIFNDPDNLSKVNTIIHPIVNDHFIEWSDKQTGKLCAIESAILFESGFDKIVDISLLVSAPLNIRIERALKRDQTSTREEVLKRINSQLPDKEKEKLADFIIINDNKQALIPQVYSFLNKL